MALSRAYVRSLLGSLIRPGGTASMRGDVTERHGASGHARAPWSEAERGGGPPRLNKDWRKTIRARLFVLAGVMGVWTAAIEARLVYCLLYTSPSPRDS